MMGVIIKFKELFVAVEEEMSDSNSVKEVCEMIEKRNPDIIIDEAYEEAAE